MLFKELDIIEPIQKALIEAGYEKPTPIQEQSIPTLLQGRDLLGCAQTGTGKTASFAIPILQQIYMEKKNQRKNRNIKSVILAPTRELAIQIEENFAAYSKHMDIKSLVIFGGVNQNPQVAALKKGVDVLIATPGRMLDLIGQKHIDLNHVKYFVLDEADSMLDMGMIHDVKRIIKLLPKKRQNIFFSATMPKEISTLADSIFNNPVKVEVAPVSSTTETVEQSVYHVCKKEKTSLLKDILLKNDMKSVLVFSRTKHGANRITKDLLNVGIECAAIHGNKSQNARQIALNDFKNGKIRVLVATDIAARGIDIDELPYVINVDLPEVAETYVHRIGRTGRAGRSGIAMSFCSAEERNYLNAIEKLINKKIEVVSEHPFTKRADEVTESKGNNRGRNNSKSNNRGRNNNQINNKDNNKEKSNNSRNNKDNNKVKNNNQRNNKENNKYSRNNSKSNNSNRNKNATNNKKSNNRNRGI